MASATGKLAQISIESEKFPQTEKPWRTMMQIGVIEKREDLSDRQAIDYRTEKLQ